MLNCKEVIIVSRTSTESNNRAIVYRIRPREYKVSLKTLNGTNHYKVPFSNWSGALTQLAVLIDHSPVSLTDSISLEYRDNVTGNTASLTTIAANLNCETCSIGLWSKLQSAIKQLA